jgi:hypothetical protein
MRASDLPPEEHAMHMDRVRQALDRVDAVNVAMAERAERRAADGTEFAERADFARQRAEQERAAAAQRLSPTVSQPAYAHQSALNEFAEMLGDEVNRINKRLAALDAGHGLVTKEIGKMLARTDNRLDRLADRVSNDGTATVALIVELERRIAALERRLEDAEKRADQAAEAKRAELSTPRLVGFVGARHDAAA